MSPRSTSTPAERYDRCLQYARDKNLPHEAPRPCPTELWPQENITLIEQYETWLIVGGYSKRMMSLYYLPMAGHVLGLNLKPYKELDLHHDLEIAMDYVQAKKLSAGWSRCCRLGLDKFKVFLAQQLGQEVFDSESAREVRNVDDFPAWLMEALRQYLRLQQHNWPLARRKQNTYRFWSGHRRIWRFICKVCDVKELADLESQFLIDYANHQQKAGFQTSTINTDLAALRGFLRFVSCQEPAPNKKIWKIPHIKAPKRLPRHLTDQEVSLLQTDLEHQVENAVEPGQRINALLDQAVFYLCWQAGLRTGEVNELRMGDLNLATKSLTIRMSKGRKDRLVFLTVPVVEALEDYLSCRGEVSFDYLLLYRNQPLKKDLVRNRIQAAGKRVGLEIFPHRLRHTFATQLLNAGCPVISIQKLLGHKRLSSTMIYARVYDQLAAESYYSAIGQIEDGEETPQLMDIEY